MTSVREVMEPEGSGSAEMWNKPEDGGWVYTKTMRVASFVWQIWKRGVLGLLLLSSLPILLPVLLLAFGVGFIFLLPFLPGVAVYFVLSRRFPALRISGWYRYLTSYTPGFITSAGTGVIEEEAPVVYEDDNIQHEESQETSNDGSQDIEEEIVSDTWSQPHIGGEGNVFQEVSELRMVPSSSPSPFEGIANEVQEGEEQSFSPKQHDIRSIEDEAGEDMDDEMVPEIQGLHPVEVLTSENGADESSLQEYAAADVSSEPSIPVADFQRPFGGHEGTQEGKEDADLSLPIDDVGDELASSEDDRGDEGKVLPQEESSAKADLPSILTEESLAEAVPTSDIFPPLEELLGSRDLEEELDAMHANREEEREVVTGEDSLVEAVPGFDPPLACEQLLPSRLQQKVLDDKVDEEGDKKVLTGEASPTEEAALDFDIPSLPEESLSSRYDHPEELDVQDVDKEVEKALIGDTSPAETVSGSDLPSRFEQLMPSGPCQKELDGKDVEEEEKALTGEASPQEAISGSDLPSTSEQLFPSIPCQEELAGKDVDEEEHEKALTAEASPAETVLGSDLPSPSELLLPPRLHQEELDGKDVDEEKQEKALTSEASPAEVVSGSDLHLSSEESLPSRQQLEKLDSKDEEEEKQEKVLTGEESPVKAALDSDVLSPSEEPLSSRDEHQEEPDGKDVGEGKEEKALLVEPSPAEEAASESGILSTFEGLLQLRPQEEELDAKDAGGVKGEKDLTGVACPAEAVSGSDLPTPSKQLLPPRRQEAVGGIVADEEEKVLSGEESLAEVSRTDLPGEKLLHEEEIDGKDADKKEERGITGEESVVEATLDSDILFPSEESLPPGQHQYAEELDGKDADEVDKRKVRGEEESPAEAVSPFDVVSEALPSKPEDSEAGQVTEEQKSNGEREPCAEESPIYESPSEYDSTQEEEEGERLEETVVTNLSANHSLAHGESHKQTGGNVAEEEEAAQDIFHEFESESEEEYFLSPGLSISEELGLTDPAHLQPPGGQDEQVPDMEAEPEEQEEGKTFARPSSAAETTSVELGSASHGQSEDNVFKKEEGVEELTVTDSASEKPLPAEVHNVIGEEVDKMAYKQQPANQELAGPDSKPPEVDQQQLDINVATEKDELDNLKGNESKSEIEDISSSNVPVEELTNNGGIGLASDRPFLSRNDDKELIRNEPSQGESQEDNVEAKDSAAHNFGTGEEKYKAVTDINGEGELAEKNEHVEEPKSTNDISLNLNPEYPTTFPVSEQKSDSGPTLEYPRECDKKHESEAIPEDAQKDTQPVVVTPEGEEFNSARFMEQQDDKSALPDIVEETREESTPEVRSDLSGFAKESHLQSGYVPELEIDDDESLNETQIPGGMLIPEQEQRQNVNFISESTSNMPEEPTSPSKIKASRDRGFVEGQQPGPLSLQSAPNSIVTEGDGLQDSHSQESSHITHSLRLEDKTLEESTAADQHEVQAKERNQEAENVPSSQGLNVAGDMEVLTVDKNEETNSSGEPTSLPQRRLSFSEAGDGVAVANLGVPISEEHNKDRQPDHEELSINTSEYIWPSEAEVHGLNGIPRGETESGRSVADNSTRTTRLEEPIPAQKPGISNPVSKHPTLSSPDLLDLPEDWQSSCRKRREDELRPDGVSPTEPRLESPASEANTAMSTPPFGFSTHSPSQQQKSRTIGRRRSLLKHNRSMNRRAAPELVRSQTWAANSATSPPHDASREFKKTRYMDQTDVKELMTRTSSVSQAQGAEEEEEKEQATKFPDVSPNCTPSSGEAERQIREEISTIKRIVGQHTPPQDSLWEEVESLSQFVGIQLQNIADVSDLSEVRKNLELVKSVLGIR